MLNLFWIFEYVTSGLFAGPLSADYPDVKKFPISVVIGILNLTQKFAERCKNMLLGCTFFWVERFPTNGQLSNFQHWMGFGKSMHLHHEGSMIGVQCQLMICRGHIRTSKVHFNLFVADGSMANGHFN